jgi:beta-1,4-mannosyltransferase
MEGYNHPNEPKNGDNNNTKKAIVLVVGDIGRSPRMQFQAASLAKNGWEVWMVGLEGSELMPEINAYISQNKIHVKTLSNPSKSGNLLWYYFQKIIIQTFLLFWMMINIPSPIHFLLVQNPPSIPTFFVAQLTRIYHRCKLVIDWHNYGWSILAISVGSTTHWTVALYRW